MSRHIELGAAPPEEPCAQVGGESYHERASEECSRWAALLRRIFRDRPEACRFVVRSYDHDFGSYLEVAVTYGDEASESFAFEVEGKLPGTWEEAERLAEATDREASREWIFTFGTGHVHPTTGEPLGQRFVRIAGSAEEARLAMFRSFGSRWGGQYPSEEEAGVEQFGLEELPLPDAALPEGRE